MIREGSLSTFQIADVCSKIKDSRYLWISVDVDCLDSSEMPGTGTPLPLGLSRRSLRDTLYASIRGADNNYVKILGFDIVEVSPQQKAPGAYSVENAVTTMNEMDAGLLAYNMLFWNFIDRFR
jgi:arginase family enzyme